ncbi:MAG: 30S ribosomal protein S6 [candidate division WOR-3 bacterium]
MNYYESVFVVNPTLSDEQIDALKQDLQAKLSAVSAKEIVELRSERRPLSYPIRKQTEGYYLIYRYQAPADSAQSLRAELRHTESILRMAFVRIPDKVALAQDKATAQPSTGTDAVSEQMTAPAEQDDSTGATGEDAGAQDERVGEA